MLIELPDPSLVVLVGTTGAGKTTFAARRFAPTETLSSDVFRALVSNDPTNQSATDDAFDALYLVADRRLARRLLTVIDATNVHPEGRAEWVALARRHRIPAVAIVLDVPPGICRARLRERPDGPRRDIVGSQRAALARSVGRLEREGFERVWRLDGVEAIDEAVVRRLPAASPSELDDERV